MSYSLFPNYSQVSVISERFKTMLLRIRVRRRVEHLMTRVRDLAALEAQHAQVHLLLVTLLANLFDLSPQAIATLMLHSMWTRARTGTFTFPQPQLPSEQPGDAHWKNEEQEQEQKQQQQQQQQGRRRRRQTSYRPHEMPDFISVLRNLTSLISYAYQVVISVNGPARGGDGGGYRGSHGGPDYIHSSQVSLDLYEALLGRLDRLTRVTLEDVLAEVDIYVPMIDGQMARLDLEVTEMSEVLDYLEFGNCFYEDHDDDDYDDVSDDDDDDWNPMPGVEHVPAPNVEHNDDDGWVWEETLWEGKGRRYGEGEGHEEEWYMAEQVVKSGLNVEVNRERE